MINLVFVSVVRFECSFGGSTPAAEAARVRLFPSKYRWDHYRQNTALRPPLFAKSPQTSTIGSGKNFNTCSKGRPTSPPTGAKRQRPPQLLRNPRRFRLHAVNNGDGMETGVFQGGFFLPNKFSYAYAIPTMPSSEPICDLDTLR